jgi:phosphoribosylaminoimidazole carboxylase (NCAIR synthetase)
MIHILILDELYQGFEDQVSFSDFISDSDNVKLLLITSRGGVSPKDKEKCLAYAEIAQPSTNGLMEKIAIEFHTKYRIDRIYVNQEEFIVRAAVLRKHFNLSNGLSVSESLLFRDKVSMKALATKHGIPTPNFAKVYTPTDIITFCKENKFPVIIKPTLSCASVGITVLHNSDELDKYLENDYFARQSYATMDTYGDLIIEKFVPSTMFHINGYAEKGQLMYVWPFQYKNTNLDFIDGNEYGNISIPQNDPLYKKLIAFTQKILSVFPQPPNLIFHLELFQNDSGDFMLCEIAARKPGF